ncbi:MAG: hypothetical protein PHO02_00905 [Candidatus Nanoarchaeia archaeon]|nr:hypothetical protein [Candidatus Nanoarchaeia archaeon]
MGWVNFSTDNADYTLVYAAHLKDADDAVFNDGQIESLDAIVLENTGHGPGITGASQFGLDCLPKIYETIMKQSHKHDKWVYLLDANVSPFGLAAGIAMMSIPLFAAGYVLSSAKEDIREASEHEKTDRRQFLKGIGKGLLGMYLLNGYSGFFLGSFTKGESPNAVETAAASVHRLPPNPLVELRNCVAARKTEEFVVPRLKDWKEKRPKIAVVFGGGHSGLKECLQGKVWRDSVLAAYKQANYLGLDIYTLDNIWEMWPSYTDYKDCKILEQNWCAARYKSGLF